MMFNASTFLPAVGALSLLAVRQRFVVASPVAVASLAGRGLVVNFWIDASRKLHPLGVLVLRQSKIDAFPEVEVATELIPADVEVSPLLDTDLSERVMELDLLADSSAAGWLVRQQELARYLNPPGQRDLFLVFAEQSDRGYWVRVGGETYINPHPTFLRFTLPLRVVRPYAEAVFESQFTGGGTINYPGTLPAPIMVTVQGPAVNPEVIVRSQSMKYVGSLAAGDVLVIDTEKLTVELNGQNALPSFSGAFPWLEPGANAVTVSSGTVTIRWKTRWL